MGDSKFKEEKYSVTLTQRRGINGYHVTYLQVHCPEFTRSFKVDVDEFEVGLSSPRGDMGHGRPVSFASYSLYTYLRQRQVLPWTRHSFEEPDFAAKRTCKLMDTLWHIPTLTPTVPCLWIAL